jgi:stress response protein SCP2
MLNKSLDLSSNDEAPVISFNTTKIESGFAVNLSKENPNLIRASVKVSWIGDDLDISAVRLNGEKPSFKTKNVTYKGRSENVPESLIFYMNLEGDGIEHGGDLVSTGDLETEAINVSCKAQPRGVTSIDFIVTSHVEAGAPYTFGEVEGLKVELVDLDTNEVLYTTDLSGDSISSSTGVVVASFAKDGKDWSYVPKTESIGSCCQGVQNILNKYYSA